MPETTRRWPTAEEMRERVRIRCESRGIDHIPQVQEALDQLHDLFSGGGFLIERKLARLTERLKDAIEQERFGPLFVDDEGNRLNPATVNDPDAPGVNATQAYNIWRAFRDIYSMDVLNSVDEEGDLL